MPFIETMSYDVKEQIVVGALIRNLRKEKKMSAADVSAFSGISTQYLTEMEKGTKKQSPSSLEAVFDTLNVKFNYDAEGSLNLCEEALENILDLNSWQMNKEYFDYVRYLLENEEIKYSYGYHYYLIFELMITDVDNLEKIVKQIDLVFNVYDNKWKAVYYFILSKKYMYSKYELAYEYINIAISYLSGDISTKLSANIYYIKSYIEDYLNLFTVAKESNRLARKIFDEHSAYKFSLTCDVDYGILLNNNGEYQQAKKVLERALKVSKQYFPESMSVIYVNLCNTYMLLEDYKKCIDMCYKGIELGYNNQYLSYYLINSLFRVNRKEECLKCINEFKHLMKSDYYKMLVDYILNYYVNKNNASEILNKLDKYSKEKLNFKLRARILELLIKDAENLGDYQRIAEYYKELIEIIKKN